MSPLPPAEIWPPSSWPAAAWPLAVTDPCWTCPQGLSGYWFLLHCGIWCRYFSYFTFPSMPGNGVGRRFNFCQPWQAWSLLAQSSTAAFGAWSAALAAQCAPGTSWAHSFRDLCPLRPFPYLLFLPPPAWSLLRIRNRVIYLGRAQPNTQDRSRAKPKLKNSLWQSALFPC